MPSVAAFIAANRFGLGPRPDELRRIDRDPRAWVLEQVAGPTTLPTSLRTLSSSSELVKKVFEARLDGKDALKAVGMREIALAEMAARLEAQIVSEQPFQERMVAFWSNHFTVSSTRFPLAVLAGAYEREAIRPHVFGRFEDMLLAVVHHPAMLTYLDNATSIGPHSPAGQRSKRGLNENLAREVLELHTLGVNGGYTQNDVTEFAKILTGWSHGGIRTKKAIRTAGPIHGHFEFLRLAHEPGPKMLLGKRYEEDGEREGVTALRAIAHHPATARHIATKLARHFVSDDPPEDTIETLSAVFQKSGGDLAEVSRALVGLDEIWQQPLAKVKQPTELIVSTRRAMGVDQIRPPQIARSLQEMGQVLWRAPSPQGWPDRADDWISPESLMRRVEWTRAIAQGMKRTRPAELLDNTIGAVASPTTKDAVERAPSVPEAVALLLASPEFQRR